jgi:hypothetical protein
MNRRCLDCPASLEGFIASRQRCDACRQIRNAALEVLSKQKAYRNNLERYKENHKNWARANPEKRAEISRQWRLRNPGKVREWSKAAAQRRQVRDARARLALQAITELGIEI